MDMSLEDKKKRLGLIPAGEKSPEEMENGKDIGVKVESSIPPDILPHDKTITSGKQMSSVTAAIPQVLDYRGVCTPVRNQGECGACWAYASIGALEANLLRMDSSLDETLDLSEQYLLS